VSGYADIEIVLRASLQLTVLVWASLSWLDGGLAQTGSRTTAAQRKYSAGPLVAGDFAGQPPPKTPINFGIEMVANTECAVRYEYRSVIEPVGRDRWAVRVTRFNCFAVLVPDKCWHTQPLSSRILDHEQGHFDLAEIAARRARRQFAERMRDGKVIASGRERRTAERQLDEEVKKAMDEVYAALAQAQKTYDEETRHGTAFRAQRRHRQWQLSELERLATPIVDADVRSKKD
jgi:hypothetical protein